MFTPSLGDDSMALMANTDAPIKHSCCLNKTVVYDLTECHSEGMAKRSNIVQEGTFHGVTQPWTSFTDG